MTTTVVPINPRHWQEMLWEDQTLWDGLGALVWAELDERTWHVMDREDEWDQVALLALKHGYTGELEALLDSLIHPDRIRPEVIDPRWNDPPKGRRQAWVFDFPMDSILANPEDAIATAIVPRVEVEPEPTVVEPPPAAEPVKQGFRKKHGTRR